MKLNCGDTCPKSGKYNVIDGNGKVINSVYVNEGETIRIDTRTGEYMSRV